MKKWVINLGLFLGVSGVAFINPAKALEKIEVEASYLNAVVYPITIPGGHSVVLAFENGEFIQSVWLDDQSILGLLTDRPLCAYIAGELAEENCGFAQYVRLTGLSRTDPDNVALLELNGPSFSQRGGEATLLTVITTDIAGGNRKVYQFLPTVTVTRPSNISMISIIDTNLQYDVASIKTGQLVAVTQGIADQESEEWGKLLTFLELVDVPGIGVEEAIQRSGVSVELLEKLEELSESVTFDVTYGVISR